MRLDKYLSTNGVGSREYVKMLIRSGRVSVKGMEEVLPETKVFEDAEVFLDGAPVRFSLFEYRMLHKPAGYLTANRDANDPVVMSLVPVTHKDCSPVGRLDKDTEGLLLITNDGALAHQLLSPKNGIEKTYYFETDVDLPADAEARLLEPIAFSDFTSRPAVLKRISERSGEITVTEGKYHEVKRLIHAIGTDVVYLKRLSFGGLTLGTLEKGESRALTDEEIQMLKSL